MYRLKTILCGVFIISSLLATSCAASTLQEMIIEAHALREKGESANAFDLYNKALITCIKEKKYSGVLDCLIGRFLVWQHLYRLEDDHIYAVFAKQEAETMSRIAKNKGILNREGEIHYFYAKACLLLEEYECAENELQKVVDESQPTDPRKGDVMSHLGFAMYMNGHKTEGTAVMLQSVNEILNRSQGLSSVDVNTMLSGAYLRLARALVLDHPLDALENFARAEKIILSDPRLVVRNGEMQIFQRKLKSLSFQSQE
jgi:tetratricopeptide (TPR) repeat protein